ncbi:universal stress protein [Natrialbaceae archaeon A-gly3]
MTETVLVPVDGSDHASAGLEYALESFPEATITALYVHDPGHDNYAAVGDAETPEEREQVTAQRILEAAREQADAHGQGLETETRTGSPHTQILESLVSEGFDGVVMGSHGESPITRPFLGHVSEAVVRRAPVTTTVVSEPLEDLQARDLPGRVLVPTDGSEQAEAALEYALTGFPTAEFTAVHVLNLPFEHDRADIEGTYLEPLLEDARNRAERILASAAEIADEHGVSIDTTTVYGKPTTEIVGYARDEDVDGIVMGGHGRSLSERLITGTVAETVTRRSELPVTLVRGGSR